MADFAVNVIFKARDENTVAMARRIGRAIDGAGGRGGVGGLGARGRRGGAGRQPSMSQLASGFGIAASNIDRLTQSTKRAIGTPIKLAMGFEQSMTEVRAVTSDAALGNNFDLLKDKARELGRSTQFTAAEVAGGLKFMGVAGLGTEKQLATISPLLDAATVSGLDLARTSDVITDVMGGFGMEAGTTMANGVEAARFAVDGMIATTLNANTNLDQLARGMFKVGPLAAKVAKESGSNFNEIAALLGTLANAGIKGAEGGTALRNVLLSLTGKPSKDMRKLLRHLGLDSKQLRKEVGKSGVAGAMRLLMEQMKDMDAPMQLFASNVLFGRRTAVSATTVLAELDDGYASLKSTLDGSAGASEKAAAEFRSTSEAGVKKLNSALEDLGITVGDKLLPALNPLIEQATEAANKFSEWAGNNPEAVKNFGALALSIVGVGTVLAPVLMAMSGIAGTASAITTMSRAFGGLGGAAGGANVHLVSAFGNLSNLRTMSLATKIGVAGLVVSTALASYEFGKMADEAFGLSDAIAGVNMMMTETIRLHGAMTRKRGGQVSLGDMTPQERAELAKLEADKARGGLELAKFENTFSWDDSGREDIQGRINAKQSEIDALQERIRERIQTEKQQKEDRETFAIVPQAARIRGRGAQAQEVNAMLAALEAAMAQGFVDSKLEIAVTDERVKVKKIKQGGIPLSVEQGLSSGGG